MTDRPSFPDDAACVGHDPDLFTCEPNERRSSVDVNRMRATAARICGGCPVKDECLARAEAGRTVVRIPGSHETIDPPFGVLGGLFYNGTRRQPDNPTHLQQVYELFHEGKADPEIAEIISIENVRSIRVMRNRLGLRRKGDRGLLETFKHGGQGGVEAHRRRGQDPCIECLAGAKEAKRQNRLREKARKQDSAAA